MADDDNLPLKKPAVKVAEPLPTPPASEPAPYTQPRGPGPSNLPNDPNYPPDYFNDPNNPPKAPTGWQWDNSSGQWKRVVTP